MFPTLLDILSLSIAKSAEEEPRSPFYLKTVSYLYFNRFEQLRDPKGLVLKIYIYIWNVISIHSLIAISYDNLYYMTPTTSRNG